VVGLDFVQLLDDGRMVNRQTAKLAQTLCGSLVFVHLDEVTRGLGTEDVARFPTLRISVHRNWTAMGMR
jgi:hypothetical protein